MSLKKILRLFVVAIMIGTLSMVGGCGSNGSGTAVNLSAIRHVFLITLENENYATTFGTSTVDSYLAQTLPAKGALVKNYYGTGHVSLDNYIAMISGQAASTATDNDCTTYLDFTLTGTTSDGQAIGTGCVYPTSIQSLPDQLTAAGFTWRAYEEDMGNTPSRESSTCGHPTLNATDGTQSATSADQYATRHNPYMYFHSIIDSTSCDTNVVNLTQLQTDIASESTTPNFIHITPNLCNDGHDAPCANGDTGGLTSANAFLEKWVPIIMASPAYKDNGLLIINFDESAYSQATSTSGSNTTVTITYPGTYCCNQQPGPNLGSFPQTTTYALSSTLTYSLVKNSYGGDQVGAVMLSPFINGGTVSTVPYNHYSLLRSIEDIFGLSHLGYAAQSGLVSFGSDIFTNL